MRITICTNTETLRSVWEGEFDAIEWSDFDIHDDDIAGTWANALTAALEEKLPDAQIDWESSFQYWHGGWGSKNPGAMGSLHYDEAPAGFDDDVLSDCIAVADTAAVAEAKRLAEEEIARHAEAEED